MLLFWFTALIRIVSTVLHTLIAAGHRFRGAFLMRRGFKKRRVYCRVKLLVC